MAIHTEFIRRFLARWETRQLVAYIPCQHRNFTVRENRAACGEPIGASGVTVGTGLDLGQQAEADLRRMGIPDALIERFRPYLGKRRQDAVVALAAASLTLTDAQYDAVDDAVHAAYIQNAARLYDRHADRSFEDISAQAQAVIVSLFYYLGGPNGRPGYRKTWALLCAGEAVGRRMRRRADNVKLRRNHRVTPEDKHAEKIEHGNRLRRPFPGRAGLPLHRGGRMRIVLFGQKWLAVEVLRELLRLSRVEIGGYVLTPRRINLPQKHA